MPRLSQTPLCICSSIWGAGKAKGEAATIFSSTDVVINVMNAPGTP